MNTNAFTRGRTLAATYDTPLPPGSPLFEPAELAPLDPSVPAFEPAELTPLEDSSRFVQIPSAALRDLRLTDFETRLLGVLIDRLGGKPFQRIRQETLAADFQKGLSTVRRALKHLESLGYLEAKVTGRSKFYALTDSSKVSKPSRVSITEHSDRSKMSALHMHISLSNNAMQSESEPPAVAVAASPPVVVAKEAPREKAQKPGSPSQDFLKEAEEALSAIAETGEYVAVSAHPDSLLALATWEAQGRTVHEVAAKAALFKTRRGTKIENYSAFFAKRLSVVLEAQESLTVPQALTAQATVKAQWCGKCESDSYRFLEVSEGTLKPCPECSPQATSKRAPEKAQTAQSNREPHETASFSDYSQDSLGEWDSFLSELLTDTQKSA